MFFQVPSNSRPFYRRSFSLVLGFFFSVDERNPARVDETIWNWLILIYSPYQVVQDVFHQQYQPSLVTTNSSPKCLLWWQLNKFHPEQTQCCSGSKQTFNSKSDPCHLVQKNSKRTYFAYQAYHVIWYIHLWKSTWNPKMEVWNMIFPCNWVIFSFHVNFRGCTYTVIHTLHIHLLHTLVVFFLDHLPDLVATKPATL